MIEESLNRLRVTLGLGDRRGRDKLGLGDRRRPREERKAEALEELERLAHSKWKGEIMKPTVGRIVHYVLEQGRGKGEVRAATIVRVWNDTCVNLQVHLDGSNDAGADVANDGALTVWKTSVLQTDETTRAVGAWFWPPKVSS